MIGYSRLKGKRIRKILNGYRIFSEDLWRRNYVVRPKLAKFFIFISHLRSSIMY